MMAQLFFRYGAMNSGKTFEIIKVAHNYEEQNKRVLTMKSVVDDRSAAGMIESRVGESRRAIDIDKDTDIFDIVARANDEEKVYCVLIDEAQFLPKHQVEACARIVDELDIPVMAFGLKNDFRNELFEGSEALLTLAEKIEEVKTICWFCGRKATMNLRVNDGQPVYEGEQIQTGGNESYYPVCRKHYYNPPMEINNQLADMEE